MPAARTPMRQVREILRMKHEAGLPDAQGSGRQGGWSAGRAIRVPDRSGCYLCATWSLTADRWALCPQALLFEIIGEPGKNRTCDPLIKSQLLYRLSYGLSQEGRNLVFDSAPVNAGIRLKSCCDALACRTSKPAPNRGCRNKLRAG